MGSRATPFLCNFWVLGRGWGGLQLGGRCNDPKGSTLHLQPQGKGSTALTATVFPFQVSILLSGGVATGCAPDQVPAYPLLRAWPRWDAWLLSIEGLHAGLPHNGLYLWLDKEWLGSEEGT